MAYNTIEPESSGDMPARCEFDGVEFSRRRSKTPVRGGVSTLFGSIRLERFQYEPLTEAKDQGLGSVSPLEIQLGIVAQNATPALAERVGRLAAGHTESEVLDALQDEHDVSFSKATLRNVTQAVGEGMAQHLHDAQKDQLLRWLREASDSPGRSKPVLAVGRDGIMLPIRAEKRSETLYREGAAGTITISNRRGKRIGTVYVGWMPEELQVTISNMLTRLITDVLTEWDGPPPRLAYITDAGFHPTDYFHNVLKTMKDPRRPGRLLDWRWVVDFYHASEYVARLADVLFANNAAARIIWRRRMLHLLKHDARGVTRVMQSTAWRRCRLELNSSQAAVYDSARGYLHRHRKSMCYAECRRLRIPIGSGITEAACKTIFTQRFKESGMSWNLPKAGSVQPILMLRLTRLSGVWSETCNAWLKSRPTINIEIPIDSKPDSRRSQQNHCKTN